MDRVGRIFLGREKDAPFVIDTREKVLPFGQAFRLEGKYEVHFRLYSTRGGGATWEYDLPGDPEMFLSCGRYNPAVRFIAENPVVLWERHGEKAHIHKSAGEYFVEQKYLFGSNHFTSRLVIRFKDAEPFPADRLLHQFVEDGLEDEPRTQGHLSIYEVKIPEEYRKTWFEPYWGVKTFLNHQFLGGEMLAKERKGDTLYALVRYFGKGWIVSPDHVKNPIRIYGDDEKFFVLAHPEPVDAVD